MVSMLVAKWWLIIVGSLAGGVVGLAFGFLIPPVFTARASFLPPQQQQQSNAAAALSSLGALAGLAGGVAGIKTPADQYVALMQSVLVSNRIIDQYNLIKVYGREYRIDAQRILAANVRIGVGKKDGLISIEVDDESPERSAAIANSYVDALRELNKTLAVSEAQQRRVFFEQQLQGAKEKLTAAQVALQDVGINGGAIKAEPRAASEAYVKARAEVVVAETKLQTYRGMLADGAPEVIQQQILLKSLRENLAKLEVNAPHQKTDADYIGRYREFKYQETLFDLFAKQYELARVDESREGALVQMVDVATAPEKKSSPKRGLIALASACLMGLVLCCWVVFSGVRSLTPR
ncbi:MAG: hypothetical protein RLY71_948 [Pseudomonadota bacterium]